MRGKGKRKAYSISVRNLKGKDYLEDQGIEGSII
jgi:hypothetical protein